MDARTVIEAVKRGTPADEEQLRGFCDGLADGTVSDAQAAAFAMAVCLKGLAGQGRAALTRAMRDSGYTLAWDLPGPVVDKHSTGGIGDCVSLVLAPALAACGVYVPMISGRGLGHTGGTLDKLESIPGLTTEIDADRMRAIVAETGCAIVAASDRIAPADRRLYAIRDVTATVDSVDLITASILSKKLAAGADALVLDIKTGSGAFMRDARAARELGQALVTTAEQAGYACRALLSDMNQPVASAVGNALEIIATMECLTGAHPGDRDTADRQPRLRALAVALGGELLELSGAVPSVDEGTAMIDTVLRDGRAAECFGRMIHAQGGPADFISRWSDRLPSAPILAEVAVPRDGYVTAIDGRAIGLAVGALGGGRRVGGDRIDASVGFVAMPALGQRVVAGDLLAEVHAAGDDAAQAAAAALVDAVTISDEPVPVPDLLIDRITA